MISSVIWRSTNGSCREPWNTRKDRLRFASADHRGHNDRCAGVECQTSNPGSALVEPTIRRPRSFRVDREYTSPVEDFLCRLERTLGVGAAASLHRNLPHQFEEPRSLSLLEVLGLRHEDDAPIEYQGQEDRIAETQMIRCKNDGSMLRHMLDSLNPNLEQQTKYRS